MGLTEPNGIETTLPGNAPASSAGTPPPADTDEPGRFYSCCVRARAAGNMGRNANVHTLGKTQPYLPPAMHGYGT